MRKRLIISIVICILFISLIFCNNKNSSTNEIKEIFLNKPPNIALVKNHKHDYKAQDKPKKDEIKKDKPNINIINKPLKLNWKLRKQSISEYVKLHYPEIKLKKGMYIVPKFIIIHSSETAKFRSVYNTFNSNYLRGRRDIQKGGRMNVCTPFVIDQDGSIYKLFYELIMGRHCIGLNYCSIGIENIGILGKVPLTQKQVEANIAMIEYLIHKHPTIEYLIGHLEYQKCRDIGWYIENMKGYLTIKRDPSKTFMDKLRKGLNKKGIILKKCE